MRPGILVFLSVLTLTGCSAGGGYGYRSSAAAWQCDDPDWFGLSACSCGRCDRDGFDWSGRRERPDRDRPDREPPPFAGKDN